MEAARFGRLYKVYAALKWTSRDLAGCPAAADQERLGAISKKGDLLLKRKDPEGKLVTVVVPREVVAIRMGCGISEYHDFHAEMAKSWDRKKCDATRFRNCPSCEEVACPDNAREELVGGGS